MWLVSALRLPTRGDILAPALQSLLCSWNGHAGGLFPRQALHFHHPRSRGCGRSRASACEAGDDPGHLANTPAAPRSPRESRAAGQRLSNPRGHGPDLQPWASQPHGGRSRNPWAWDRYSRRACGACRQAAIARGLTQAPRSFPTRAKSVLSPAPLRGSDCGGV